MMGKILLYLCIGLCIGGSVACKSGKTAGAHEGSTVQVRSSQSNFTKPTKANATAAGSKNDMKNQTKNTEKYSNAQEQ